jgi:ERCC4-type nuclease
LATTYTILVDQREKKPMQFPSHLVVWNPSSTLLAPHPTTIRLQTKTVLLPTGDYVLESAPRATVIERKQHLDELAANLTTRDGLRRFRDELIRMQEFTHRVLFLEGDPLSLTRTRDCNPAVIRDILLSTLAEHRVELMMLPCSTANARNHAAEWLASRLIFGAMQCPPPPPPMSSSVKTA